MNLLKASAFVLLCSVTGCSDGVGDGTTFGECIADVDMSMPAEDPYRAAAERYVLLQNRFTNAGAEALFSNEPAHLAKKRMDWIAGQVGLCSTVSPIITGKVNQRWGVRCEHGKLQLDFQLDDEGKMRAVRPAVKKGKPSAHVARAARNFIANPKKAFRTPSHNQKRWAAAAKLLNKLGECRPVRTHLATNDGVHYILRCDKGEATLRVHANDNGAIRVVEAWKGAHDKQRRRRGKRGKGKAKAKKAVG